VDLILWRHAEAEDSAPDDARRLTPRGFDQAERMAAWLAKRVPASYRLLVSPARRTQQTAAALQKTFETLDALAPGASVGAVLKAANWPASSATVIVVGHQPTLGAVAARLLGGDEASWSIRKGAVWWLADRDREGSTSVVLRAAISPDLL
jgi:phosphohistidine phosphatase